MIQNIILKLFLLALFSLDLVSAANRGNCTNGSGIWDIAIAILETEDLNTDYEYGDGKSGDSTNYGIFKQNWFMLRTSTSQFKGQYAAQTNYCNVLNRSLAQDIKTRQESQKLYGLGRWFGDYHNGESGLNNYQTKDINAYKNGVNWIHNQLTKDKKYLTDNTRFCIDVTPI